VFEGQVSLKTLSLLGDVIFSLPNNRCAYPLVTVFSFLDPDKSRSLLVGASDPL